MDSKKKWTCPVCRGNAYQRFGGITLPAHKIELDATTNKEKRNLILFKTGTHFMCKGCSVFFSNPNLFNKENMKNE